MSDDKKFEWRILGESVIGASHVRTGKPNQDALLWRQAQTGESGIPLFIAIADGHGGDKYFRSNIGARTAVEVTEHTLHRFVGELELVDRSNIKSTAAIKQMAEKLPNSILYYWREAVEQHWRENLPTKAEWAWLHDKANAKARQEISANTAKPYGATLLTVLVTKDFIFYLQLGDGDILVVSETGEVSRPVPGDERLLGNETTSLASAMPKDFRSHFQVSNGTPPALILLSTDGYANSFEEVDGFLKVGSDIWSIIQKDGIEKVETDLQGWLRAATKKGSGDDITLGILCRMSAVGAQKPNPLPQPVKTEVSSGTSRSQVPADPTPISHGTALYGSSNGNTSSSRQSKGTQPLSTEPPPNDKGAPAFQHTSKQRTQNSTGQPTSMGGGIPAGLSIEGDAQPGSPSVPQPPTDQDHPVSSQSPDTSGTNIAGPPPQQKQILTVSSTKGAAQYTSISDALGDAAPGALIRVLPGVYTKPLTLDKYVEIVGETADGPVIIESQTPCIQMQTNEAILRKLTLRGKTGLGRLLSKEKPAIDIPQGNLRLEQCDITSESSVCMYVHGEAAQTKLQQCSIHDGKGKGIVFSEKAQGLVNTCTIYGNTGAAIELRNGSDPTIQQCQICEGKGVGIYACDNCRGTINTCTIYGNVAAGIDIRRGGNPLIENCQIYNGKSHGILIDASGQGKIVACTIYGNTFAGIEIQDSSNPTIQKCYIYAGKKSGVAVTNGGRGRIEECQIYDNAAAGIEIKRSNSMILHCHIHDGKHAGIYIGTRGEAFVEGGSIYGNLHSGIELQEGGMITVRRCHINKNEPYALQVQKASKVTVEDCDLRNNTVGPWHIDLNCQVDQKNNLE